MHKIKFPSEVKLVPQTPGVYLFKNKAQEIIYIGKAKNLKNRVKSYTSKDLLPKTRKMTSVADSLSYIEVQSEFEALLLEATLVRRHMPLYNIELKDDKSPLYIGITNEEYPRVLTFRQTDLKLQKLLYEFGPYIDGKSAKYILRALRKIFPYSQHRIGKRACIYHEIGLCDPCPSFVNVLTDEILKNELKNKYLTNIRRLKLVLSGKKNDVAHDLEKEMIELSKQEQYEAANDVKSKLRQLQIVTAPKFNISEYVKNPNFVEDVREKELVDLYNIVCKKIAVKAAKIRRIECFDIAHLSGTNPTASMVTFIDGIPDKKYYRHFKINKGKIQNNDALSMKEVLERRVKHFEDWGKPDLIIIDGGKPQLSLSYEILKDLVPFVGLAKRYETLIFFDGKNFSEKLLDNGPAKNLVVRLRNEAHRFARRLHHSLVTKTLLGEV